MRQFAAFSLLGVLLLPLSQLLGQCDPPVQPNQPFPVAAGPATWFDPGSGTTQTRRASESPLSSPACHGAIGNYDPRPCSCTDSHPPCSGANPTISLRMEGTRVVVDYEAPNLYCTNTGDWPVFFTCTNDPQMATTRLALYSDPGLTNVIKMTFVYFEKGTWDTGIDLTCG